MAEFDTQSGINLGMVQDVQNLDKLRRMSQSQSKEGQQGALMAAARQFESIFTQTLFKGMRQANSVLTEGNPVAKQFSPEKTFTHGDGRVLKLPQRTERVYKPYQPPSASNDLIAASKVGKDFADNEKKGEMKGELNGAESPLNLPRRPHRTVPPMGSSPRASALDGSAKVFDSPEEFVDRLMPLAKKAADKLGLSPAVLVAQAALESGAGKGPRPW